MEPHTPQKAGSWSQIHPKNYKYNTIHLSHCLNSVHLSTAVGQTTRLLLSDVEKYKYLIRQSSFQHRIRMEDSIPVKAISQTNYIITCNLTNSYKYVIEVLVL